MFPVRWDDARDGAFFKLVTGLFAPEFLYGASVLLASYDGEAERVDPAVVRYLPRRFPARDGHFGPVDPNEVRS
jgi:hypothetical protein